MDTTAILSIVHSERAALVDDLGSLTQEQWATPSLCSAWTVRDVLAHMTAAASLNGPKFFGALVSSGFRFEKVQQRGIEDHRGADAADTVARFRAIVNSNGRPPGPIQTMLGETIVHAEDIRRPLGIAHTYPSDAVLEAATFFTKSNLIIGAKKRIAGLTLRATDASWTAGSGPEVSGPALDLLLAMTGRSTALASCEGPGVDTLRTRP